MSLIRTLDQALVFTFTLVGGIFLAWVPWSPIWPQIFPIYPPSLWVTCTHSGVFKGAVSGLGAALLWDAAGTLVTAWRGAPPPPTEEE